MFENTFNISDNRNINRHILTDGRRINIDMNFFCILREHFYFSGHSIIKPRTNSNKHIALIDGHIGVPRTMHAEHAQRQFALFGIYA